MTLTRYIVAAAAAMVAAFAFYVIKFRLILGYGFADDSAIWGQFGDYMGGSLNPILSFISIVLLIKSLNLQNQANVDLREELKDSKQTEKLRSFSTLFFNMIASQKSLLDSFIVNAPPGNGMLRPGPNTIIYIEDELENLRGNGADDKAIVNFLNQIDGDERIYGILRGFYITVKIVTEKLSDSNGFTIEDRKDHLMTLINFTDFAQLRLIVIAIQFFDAPASSYLRDNIELNAVLQEVGLGLDLY
ncbi:hypothetical protein [Pseudoduganella sp. R-34]|uniref:hypothetical protein n=1 Tax=Pseudoduganella sp. R-34 TaxID=3404062 RepID=UPI003CED58B9